MQTDRQTFGSSPPICFPLVDISHCLFSIASFGLQCTKIDQHQTNKHKSLASYCYYHDVTVFLFFVLFSTLIAICTDTLSKSSKSALEAVSYT